MFVREFSGRCGALKCRVIEPQATAPTLTQKQSIRVRRYALAAFTYLLLLVPLGVAYAFDFVRLGPALVIAAAIVGINGTLYFVFRSGLNLRFKDPSLTKVQVYLGVILLMVTLYLADVERGVTLGLCFLIFLFGVFRMTTREFRTLTLFTLCAYALVINLLMYLRPQTIPSVQHEWFNWLLMAASLPWFGVVGGKISALRERLRARNVQLEEAVGTIHAMATRDDVTGLYTRPFFTESLRHALLQADRHRRSAALLFIDADRFKVINDSLGHGAGDRVLRELGNRIVASVRGSDIVGRLGGDEFVVLVESFQSMDDLRGVAQKLVRAVSQPYVLESRELALSVSVGIAVAPEDGRDEHELMRNADIAMYRAKSQGRNGFSFYASQMGTLAEDRLALEAELGRAVERGELRLFFQPKIRIEDGKIAGAEALVRWQHPRLGLLEPDHFIHVAEETGAIIPIGRWVLERACHAAALWHGSEGVALRVAVNLSARQFADPGLPGDVDAALSRSGLDPSLLEFELTESIVMQEPEQAASLMLALREKGIRLSIDDFGTGYSSLGYLKRFPLTTVKIDRSFVNELPNDADDAAIVRAVLAMARSLKLDVVAEGVERAEQLVFLQREGCHEYQGYYCSKPVPDDALIHILKTGFHPQTT
jgi:diguanylate cyclase (GGDEF)-like protein